MAETLKAAPFTAKAMADHWTGRAHRFNPAASHVRHKRDWQAVFTGALGNAPLDVVDLGCGTGACALLLADLGHRVRAVDGSEGMLAVARKEADTQGLNVAFVHSTMDDADLENESCDVVTIRNVLWTLENPGGAVALARRVLRPGGTILLSDGIWYLHRENNSAAHFGAQLPFFNGLEENDARKMLSDYGFEDPRSWHHMFETHPYGSVYDDPTRAIEFFVLTATKS